MRRVENINIDSVCHFLLRHYSLNTNWEGKEGDGEVGYTRRLIGETDLKERQSFYTPRAFDLFAQMHQRWQLRLANI